jgi:hypothetical protein
MMRFATTADGRQAPVDRRRLAPRLWPLQRICALALAAFIIPGVAQALSLTVCGDSSGTLACPAGATIAIHSAFYGRRDTATCADNAVGPSSPASACSLDDALPVVQGWCQGRRSCWVPGTWPSDPCPGIFKYSQIRYSCSSNSTSPAPTHQARSLLAPALGEHCQ